MIKAKSLYFLLLGLLFCMASAIVSAQTTTVIKFSLVAERDTPKGKAAQRFKELVEEASHQRIRVDVYPNSLLYKEADELEALQLGAVQMLAPTLSRLSQFGLQDFEVFDLPFLFHDSTDVARITEGPIGKALLKKVESKGMVGLGYWNNGFKVMTANRPLHLPEDFTGLKMRIYPSRVLDKQMDLLGAQSQIVEAQQTYVAMKARIIDGGEGVPLNIRMRKLYEVQKHLTVSHHGYMGSAIVVNRKFWDGLPAVSRMIIERALREATIYANNLTEQENAAALAALQKNPAVQVHVLTPAEEQAWRLALHPAYADFEGRVGRALSTAVSAELSRSRSTLP